MHRFQRISANAQSIRAQLYAHERIIQERDGVGLYDGKTRTAAFDDGRLYLTSHRLIYLDSAEPYRNSRYLDLQEIKQTEYWVGFMKSSPKITLVFDDSKREAGGGDLGLGEEEGMIPLAAQMWTCHVCGFNNPMATGIKCTLCGIPRSAGASQITSQSGTPSASTPSSRPSSPAIINRPDSTALNACPACTYLNHPSMLRCELCDTSLATSSPANKQAITATQLVANLDRQSGTVSPAFAKLSFRKGGDKQFYTALKTALQAKEWDIASSAKRASHHGVNALNPSSQTFGINGILKNIDVDARDREEDMQEALGDLNTLMKRAQEMVRMAESFSAKLAATEADSNTEAVTAVAQSMKVLGLQSPVIARSGDVEDEKYHRELAKELGAVLLGQSSVAERQPSVALMVQGDPKRELIGLDEVWCMWNRARGVALVSPQDLRSAAMHLPDLTSPQVRLRTFPSGLNVLYLPRFDSEVFAVRIQASLLQEGGGDILGLTTLDIARREGISVLLAHQMLELVEDSAESPVVRDEGDLRTGLRWQPNLFELLERAGISSA